MKKLVLLLSVGVGAILYACNPKPATSSENDTTEIAKNKPDTALSNATAANQFADQAAIGGLMEVESSARMIKHTENPDIQNLATIMVKDHGAANAELKIHAKKEKLSLPQVLPAEKQEQIAKLNALQEEEQNRFYADLMVKEHLAAVALFTTASESEKNPTLKAFATKHLPILKAHLAHAQSVQKTIHAIKNDKGDVPLKVANDRNPR